MSFEDEAVKVELAMAPLSKPDPDYHTVFIWMTISPQQVGHSSLLLSDGSYVSWWPKGKKDKIGPLEKRANCSVSRDEDIYNEGFEPDYTFNIPLEKLDVRKMSKYWKRCQERGYYSIVNRNCCSMVYRVLSKGGAPYSFTAIWRPETLRRYLVTYLGGGSALRLFWNMPGSDEQYKANHTLFLWKPRETGSGHASLLLEGKHYISWWPFLETNVDNVSTIETEEGQNEWIQIHHGTQIADKAGDEKLLNAPEDITITFRPRKLDLCGMKRRWREFTKNETNVRWNVNSFCLLYEILLAGGGPVLQRLQDDWSVDTLESYVKNNFYIIQSKPNR